MDSHPDPRTRLRTQGRPAGGTDELVVMDAAFAVDGPRRYAVPRAKDPVHPAQFFPVQSSDRAARRILNPVRSQSTDVYAMAVRRD